MNKKITAIILLNVLAGLLFSCGEGVRLLPFPGSGIAGNSQSPLKSGKKNPYQPNIHRFETDRQNFYKKIQRDNPQKICSKDNRSFAENSLGFSRNPGKRLTLSSFRHFKSNLFFDSEGSRAPPFVS